jgi:hypothetical protein
MNTCTHVKQPELSFDKQLQFSDPFYDLVKRTFASNLELFFHICCDSSVNSCLDLDIQVISYYKCALETPIVWNIIAVYTTGPTLNKII